MPRVGELFDELMTHPDAGVRDRVEEMMDLFDAFHREGLGRLVEMIRAWRGEIFLESVGPTRSPATSSPPTTSARRPTSGSGPRPSRPSTPPWRSCGR